MHLITAYRALRSRLSSHDVTHADILRYLKDARSEEGTTVALQDGSMLTYNCATNTYAIH
jgi:hypothetical protein